MDSPVILTWNVTNWITISLMALLGFMVFSFVINTGMRFTSKKEA